MATFTVQAAGTAPITYQWQESAAETGPWVDMVGETSRSLTVDDTSTQFYRAVVTNDCGSVISDVVEVINDLPTYECDAFEKAALNSSSQAYWPANDGQFLSNEEELNAVRKIGNLRSVFSNSVNGPSTIPDACDPETSLSLGGGGGGGSMYGVNHVYGGSGFNGSFAAAVIHRTETSNGSWSPVLMVYDLNNGTQTSVQYLDSNDMRIVFDTSSVETIDLIDVAPNLNVPHLLFFEQDFDAALWAVTIDGIVVGSGTISNPSLGGTPVGELQMGTATTGNTGSQSYIQFWGEGTIPAADKAALIDGWERNKADYTP